MKIITIGDSHTAGYPGFDPQTKGDNRSSYQYWLRTLLESKYSKKYEVINLGLPGDTSKGILERTNNVLEILDLNEVGLFIINGGGNDWGFNPIDYSDTLTNLMNAGKLVRKKNISVIISSISPFGNEKIIHQLEEISQELKTLVIKENDKGIFYYNWFKLLFDTDNRKITHIYNSGDNEHLTIDGYRFLGESIANFIEQNIKLPY